MIGHISNHFLDFRGIIGAGGVRYARPNTAIHPLEILSLRSCSSVLRDIVGLTFKAVSLKLRVVKTLLIMNTTVLIDLQTSSCCGDTIFQPATDTKVSWSLSRFSRACYNSLSVFLQSSWFSSSLSVFSLSSWDPCFPLPGLSTAVR